MKNFVFGSTTFVVFSFLMLFCTGIGQTAETLTVCQPAGTCLYDTIQEAIDNSIAGDTVLVDDGTYYEHIDFKGLAITVESVNGRNSTTIDGSKSDSVVIFKSAEGADSVLKGFTITNGLETSGGGIDIEGASPTVESCLITGNEATSGGGGLFGSVSSLTLINSQITGNIAGGAGGGISIQNGGGGHVKIDGCLISDNTALTAGGIQIVGEGTVLNTAITGNSATADGGGMRTSNSPTILTNCTITGNRTDEDGGGIRFYRSTPTVTNTTISGNYAAAYGGGIWFAESTSTVVNSILWGNEAGLGGDQIVNMNGALTVDYSDVQVGDPGDLGPPYPGAFNINEDPLFVEPVVAASAPTVTGDYRLKSKSPCLDAGSDDGLSYTELPADDIDGELRYSGSGYDMGSDEYTNSSFEYGTRKTFRWKGKNLSDMDKRVTNKGYRSRCSFRMTGSTANKSIKQAVHHEGNAGDALLLQGRSRAAGPMKNGGPYRLEAKVFYEDGTKKTYKVGFPKKTHNSWKKKNKVITARQAYSKILLTARYAGQGGTVWFDEVELLIQ